MIIWLHETTELWFRDLMESLVSQNYEQMQIYVLDENESGAYARIVSEFFPEDDRVHYRRLRSPRGRAYAYNIGFHYVLTGYGKAEKYLQGDYVFLVGQHDRLQPDALLRIAGALHAEEEAGRGMPQLIYTDHDLLVGEDRMEPHFKPGIDRELLRHRNYIGEHVLLSLASLRATGQMQESLREACVYEYLLRLTEDKRMRTLRIPQLLYHKRRTMRPDLHSTKKTIRKRYEEHAVAVQAHLTKQGVLLDGDVRLASQGDFWEISYDGKDAAIYPRAYMFLHDPSVRPFGRRNLQRMYGLLRQPDVAVVGARFLKGGFAIEQCGYLYATDGTIYPAFYDQKIYRPTYENLAMIPHEVSAVDFRYCMIDAKAYRHLGGLDVQLSGREQMLDFCMRARAAGYRTIVDPAIVVRSPGKEDVSSEAAHAAFLEKWGETLAAGDPFYNPNLPMGLLNYVLDAAVES